MKQDVAEGPGTENVETPGCQESREIRAWVAWGGIFGNDENNRAERKVTGEADN